LFAKRRKVRDAFIRLEWVRSQEDAASHLGDNQAVIRTFCAVAFVQTGSSY
jgi:hypothetical protein